MTNLETLIIAKELIEHLHFDEIELIVLREGILKEINRLLVELSDEVND